MIKRPESAVGNKRPMSRYSVEKAGEEVENPRYKCENILMLELDMPTRTTRDWEGPDPDLANGLSLLTLDQNQNEMEIDEMVIQASPTVFKSKTSVNSLRGSRQKSSKSSTTERGDSKSQFPSARGLVPR